MDWCSHRMSSSSLSPTLITDVTITHSFTVEKFAQNGCFGAAKLEFLDSQRQQAARRHRLQGLIGWWRAKPK